MEIVKVDEAGRLYFGPDIDDWAPLAEHGITAIIDLDDDMDSGVPQILNDVLYIYFPIDDGELPDLDRLHALAWMGAHLVANGQKIISHCGLGHNRSALMAGMILTYLGLTGEKAVALLRARRPGALYNKKFASYLQAQPAQPISPDLNVEIRPAEDEPPIVLRTSTMLDPFAPGSRPSAPIKRSGKSVAKAS